MIIPAVSIESSYFFACCNQNTRRQHRRPVMKRRSNRVYYGQKTKQYGPARCSTSQSFESVSTNFIRQNIVQIYHLRDDYFLVIWCSGAIYDSVEVGNAGNGGDNCLGISALAKKSNVGYIQTAQMNIYNFKSPTDHERSYMDDVP